MKVIEKRFPEALELDNSRTNMVDKLIDDASSKKFELDARSFQEIPVYHTEPLLSHLETRISSNSTSGDGSTGIGSDTSLSTVKMVRGIRM